jgi:peptidyl-prolyl cis-trans isomerase C
MNVRSITYVLLLAAVSTASAQVASHSSSKPTTGLDTNLGAATAPAAGAPAAVTSMQVSDKPVVRVNGAVLTDRDLLREMLSIFPYARQHGNNFPKSQEQEIRDGAMRMIVFEELVYQQTQKQKMTIPPVVLQQAVAAFRSQFSGPQEYQAYLNVEAKGSEEVLRQRIRRSLLIEKFLHTEVDAKEKISPAELRAAYDKNPNEFKFGEKFAIQTISIMPPPTASDRDKKKAKERAEDALRQAKAAKNYQEFGLLAEKLSEDDFHVNMGDHKLVDRDKLPPEIIKAALAMKQGQVSNLLQFGSYYTFFRLNAHIPAGKLTFDQVKNQLRTDLQKSKHEELRSNLGKRLRQNAKIEEL